MLRIEVFELIDIIDLSNKADSIGEKISQGEKKILALAMTLANRPKLLLLMV